MTDLERRALLGDKQAQEECTRKGIVLRCPACGSNAHVLHKDLYKVCCDNVLCGNETLWQYDEITAIKVWNTRPSFPIGRCGECAHWYKKHCAHGPCATEPTDADFFCGSFEPKGGEENAAD